MRVTESSADRALVELLHKVSRTGKRVLNVTVNLKTFDGNTHHVLIPIDYVGILGKEHISG